MNSKAQLLIAGALVTGIGVAGYIFVVSDDVQATLQTGVKSVIDYVDNSPPSAPRTSGW